MNDIFSYLRHRGDIAIACREFCNAVEEIVEDTAAANKTLKLENEKLKSEVFKDEYIKELENRIEKLTREINLGFPLSENEYNMVEEWKKKHLEEKHNDLLSGPIGGTFNYEFIPTSIGTFGTCICGRCGEKFPFQDL